MILKAYTDNNFGSVALRSSDPFDVPNINFRSFSEGPPGHAADIAALCEAVERMRAINSKIKGMKREIQPGPAYGPTVRPISASGCRTRPGGTTPAAPAGSARTGSGGPT